MENARTETKKKKKHSAKWLDCQRENSEENPEKLSRADRRIKHQERKSPKRRKFFFLRFISVDICSHSLTLTFSKKLQQTQTQATKKRKFRDQEKELTKIKCTEASFAHGQRQYSSTLISTVKKFCFVCFLDAQENCEGTVK